MKTEEYVIHIQSIILSWIHLLSLCMHAAEEYNE